jgi:hypothetical protein
VPKAPLPKSRSVLYFVFGEPFENVMRSEWSNEGGDKVLRDGRVSFEPWQPILDYRLMDY